MRTFFLLSLVAPALCANFAAAQEAGPVKPSGTTASSPAAPLLAQARAATPQPATPASARGVRPPARGAATPAAAETATPETAEKKRGLLQRMFGPRGRATPAPAATPAATPPPATPRPRPKTTRRTEPAGRADSGRRRPAPATPDPADKPEEPAPVAAEPEQKPAPPAATPPAKKGGRTKGSRKVAATPAPEPKELSKEQLALQQALTGGDPEAIEKAKYDLAKTEAATDPRIVELKEKADNALTDEEGRKALRTYNKALFQKMRSLDDSIKDRIDSMETAVMKRLEGPGE